MTHSTAQSPTSSSTDVLFVTHNFPRRSGDFAGRFIWILARELTRLGVRVSVLAPHHPGAPEKENLDGVQIVRFRYGSDEREIVAYRGDLDQSSASSFRAAGATLRFLNAFRKATAQEIARLRPRAVHAHWWIPAGWATRRPARKIRAKFVLTAHGTDIRLLDGFRGLRIFPRRIFRAAHEISAVSTWLKGRLCRWFPEVAPKVTVIPMPVDRGPFGPGTSPNNEIPVVLSVARYVEQKRLFDLMDAAAILKARGRPLRFRLVGQGPLEKELHDRKFVHGLVEEITLVPMMSPEELAAEYRRADLVVLCSQDEGFGMTLVEAQLCGRPVIGTRSGGITDIIEDGKSGVLVEPRNPAALADAIEYVLVDTAERARLAEGGRRSAMEHFDPAVVAARFVDLYGLE